MPYMRMYSNITYVYKIQLMTVQHESRDFSLSVILIQMLKNKQSNEQFNHSIHLNFGPQI
jgi:hypothetical protein